MSGYSRVLKTSVSVSSEGKLEISRRGLIKALVDTLGITDGTIIIKIQDGVFVNVECSTKFKTDKEGLTNLENFYFAFRE